MIKNRNIAPLHVIRLCVWLFIVCLSPVSLAQKFTLGVKGGGSLTWPGFGDKEAKDVFHRKLKPGYHAGIIIGFPLKDNYNLLLEGGASRKGRIITFNDDPKWENNMSMYMTDMSMMLRRSFRFMLNKNTPAEGFINIGPEINYWLNSSGFVRVTDGPKYKYDVLFAADSEPDVQGDYTLSLQRVNRWLFSLGIGAGIKAPLGNNRFISAELRFLSGHTFLGKADSAWMERFIWGDGGMQDTMKTNLKTVAFNIAYTLDIDLKEKNKGKSTIKKKLKK
jgi:hypothetical protein